MLTGACSTSSPDGGADWPAGRGHASLPSLTTPRLLLMLMEMSGISPILSLGGTCYAAASQQKRLTGWTRHCPTRSRKMHVRLPHPPASLRDQGQSRNEDKYGFQGLQLIREQTFNQPMDSMRFDRRTRLRAGIDWAWERRVRRPRGSQPAFPSSLPPAQERGPGGSGQQAGPVPEASGAAPWNPCSHVSLLPAV